MVFVIVAELLGLVAYYADTGALFYTHDKAYGDLLPTPEDRLLVGEAVHPYFGSRTGPARRSTFPSRCGAAPPFPRGSTPTTSASSHRTPTRSPRRPPASS
jgi:hypothetical protein